MNLASTLKAFDLRAGGPGSGPRHSGAGSSSRDAVESYLKERGYKMDQHYDPSETKANFWTRTNGGSGENSSSTDSATHTVKVNSDGSWEHYIEQIHKGDDIGRLKQVAASFFLGRGVRELKQYLQAGGPGSGRKSGNGSDAAKKMAQLHTQSGHDHAIMGHNYAEYGQDGKAHEHWDVGHAHEAAASKFNQAVAHYGVGDYDSGDKAMESGYAKGKQAVDATNAIGQFYTSDEDKKLSGIYGE